MELKQAVAVFWFRRDLRLNDNAALFQALTSGIPVLPIFIFDSNILKTLNKDDKRVSFIFQAINHLNIQLKPYNASVNTFYGNPVEVFEKILQQYNVANVYTNHDYEPYAIERDLIIKKLLSGRGVLFITRKDQVVFEKNEIVKSDGDPYTVFTPYSKAWLNKLASTDTALHSWNSEYYLFNLLQNEETGLRLDQFGFQEINSVFKPFLFDSKILGNYALNRDFPSLDATSHAGVHLRFGTVSIRSMVAMALQNSKVWLNELIWREFFMQILWHFPQASTKAFKPKYQFINWIDNEQHFELWKQGHTGFPLVDAGMRELNETGFMHNRVRMVTASFLVKHLLINWQWGEAYFAEKLLDFDLSSNNGNWQWAAGTGCDAAPYFRIFNPDAQTEKFDKDLQYIKKWIPGYDKSSYIKPIIDHNFARNRCLEEYKKCL